jgi:hypothetical protein
MMPNDRPRPTGSRRWGSGIVIVIIIIVIVAWAWGYGGVSWGGWGGWWNSNNTTHHAANTAPNPGAAGTGMGRTPANPPATAGGAQH